VAADLKDLLEKLKRAHRDYFALRIVHPDELPEIMTKHTYTGAMGSAYFALITGIFFVYFGNEIGLSRFQWGVMGSVGSVLLLASAFVFIPRLPDPVARAWATKDTEAHAEAA